MLTQIFQELRRREASGEGFPNLAPNLSRGYESAPFNYEDGLDANAPGLYGLHGVLPDYFTDELLLEGEDREGMRAFFDIFNHRLLEVLYRVWSRYQLLIDDALKSDDEIAQIQGSGIDRLGGKLGDSSSEDLEFRGLRWHKLALYRRPVRTADGLLELLKTFFDSHQVELQPFELQYRPIPDDQHAILGGGLQIGAEGNMLIGETMPDIGGGFRLFFRELDYDSYLKLQPGGETRELLSRMVGDFTHYQLDSFLSLELRRDEVPDCVFPTENHTQQPSLGTPGCFALGRNLWLKTQPLDQHVVIDTGGLA